MNILDRALAISPVLVGVMFFAVALIIAEYFVVYRNRVSDYSLRVIDLIWVCTSAVALLFLLVNEREVRLRDHVSEAENHSVMIRNKLEFLSRKVSDICMAEQISKLGIITDYSKSQLAELEDAGRKAYTDNGFLMTPQCMDPIFLSNILSITGPDALWRQISSVKTGEDFYNYYKEFFDDVLPSQRLTQNAITGQAIQNGAVATIFFKSQTDELVRSKKDAGRAQSELQIVHILRSVGVLWPFPLSLALALRLAKAHHDVRKARPSRETNPTS